MAISEDTIVNTVPFRLSRKATYIPALDGWRAIAVIAVMIHHDDLHCFGRLSTKWIFLHGKHGVDLFFAISGLLICWILLDEEKVSGCISLRNFYLRRAFRILPPFLVYLGVIAILALTRVLHISLREWLGSVFFLRNYLRPLGKLGPDSWFTVHLWSLAVEEHFYLLLPALLLFTPKRWRVAVLLGLAAAVEIHRFYLMKSVIWYYVYLQTDVRLDGVLISAAFAVLAQSGNVKERMKQWLRFWPLLTIPVAILYSRWEDTFWIMTISALLMPMIVLGSVLNPNSYMVTALEWAPLKYIGRISYSLYLWQQMFITGHYYVIRPPLGIMESMPLRYGATLIIAMASYHFLELPLIKLGHRLAAPATSTPKDTPIVIPMTELNPVRTESLFEATLE